MRLVNLLGLLMTGTSALCLIDLSMGTLDSKPSLSEPETRLATQVERVISPHLQRSISAAVSSETTPIAFKEVAVHLVPQIVAQHDAPKSVQAGDMLARRELAVEIKLGLKRLGCFEGNITGDWDRQAQLATSAFLSGVNARLPVSDPDLVLVALVRAQVAQTCTVECSAVEARRVDRRCQPSVVKAREVAEVVQKKPADAVAIHTPDRMSLSSTVSVEAEPRLASRPPMPAATVMVRRASQEVAVRGPSSWREKVFENPSGR